MKKLGVVLPTYNRANYAYENVTHLIPQLAAHKDSVTLLISDNASTDNTKMLLEPLSGQHPDIICYVRQKENIGPHANFYYGVKNIDAEYIYLLGDDDIVSPNFIDTILKLLYDNPGVGLLHFNYLEGPEDLHIIRNHHKRIFDNNLVKKYKDGKQFVKELLIAPSFMSANVFLRDCMLKGLETNYHDDVYGYDWLVCLYTGILDTPCLYYDLPLVVQRYGGLYQNFALNTILGQHKVFEYLADKVEGIVNIWEEETKHQNVYDVIAVISTIPQFRKFYKKKYSDISGCLKSKWQRFCLFIAVHFWTGISGPILKCMLIANKLYFLSGNKNK